MQRYTYPNDLSSHLFYICAILSRQLYHTYYLSAHFMLTFKILIDNRKEANPAEKNPLISEHALSIFIEYNGIKILCDTGASSSFMKNAAFMGVDLSNIDFCFISHGHSDHTGGIVEYMNKVNNKCSIYLSDQIKGKKFHSCRGGKQRDISAPSLLSAPSQLKPITGSCQIVPGIFAITPSDYGYPKPIGNKYLTSCAVNNNSDSAHKGANSIQECSCAVPDTFSHELALAIATPKGLVIFSPCTHNGIFNVIESCKEQTGISNVHAFIGGLHLVDDCETSEQIAHTAKTFMHKYNNAQLFTGHCTGNIAINILNEVMPETQFKVFHTGFQASLL